ncbi:hypothetical protein PQI23_09230 [Leucobacter sp. USCH14]|uniref:hypothetical protein n=1 Tax=Leucobacter sp. USCH14 TaxID=3024838 RepID=UPI0030B637A9
MNASHGGTVARRRRSGIAVGALLLTMIGATTVVMAAVGSTVAAYTDRADLRISAEARFDAVYIDDDGSVTGFGSDGLQAELTGDEPFVPGATAVTSLRIGNNSAQVPMALTAQLAGVADVSTEVRVSAALVREDGSTEMLIGDPDAPEDGVALTDAAVPVVPLAAREAGPLPDGATWSGPVESATTLRIFLHLLDTPELHAQEAGELNVSIALTATADS